MTLNGQASYRDVSSVSRVADDTMFHARSPVAMAPGYVAEGTCISSRLVHVRNPVHVLPASLVRVCFQCQDEIFHIPMAQAYCKANYGESVFFAFTKIYRGVVDVKRGVLVNSRVHVYTQIEMGNTNPAAHICGAMSRPRLFIII